MTDPLEPVTFITPENDHFYSRRKYMDLSPHIHEIRLLWVHPTRLTASELPSVFPEWIQDDTDAAEMVKRDSSHGFDEDFICCKLMEPMQLDHVSGKYAALSYCAGSVNTTKRIMIDGFWFNAFANLEHAIDAFINRHDPDSENMLWTDQACINQVGHSEKTHQVGFMRQIYENAKSTYVVLSTPSSPTRGILPGVEAVRLASRSFYEWMKEFSPEQTYQEYDERECSAFFSQLLLEKPDHPVCYVLPQLFDFLDLVVNAKWWTRAWVFQEFIVSAQVYFLYGAHCLSLQDLKPMLLFEHWNTTHSGELSLDDLSVPSVSASSDRLRKNVKVLEEFANRRQQSTTPYKLPYTFCMRKSNSAKLNIDIAILYMIINDSRVGFQATDQRDMFYAFTGLTHAFSAMVPNYSPANTISRVFLEVAEKALEYDMYFEGKSMLILKRAASTKWCSELTVELPSWCPSWTSSPHESEHYDTPVPYTFPHSKCHFFIYDVGRSPWKIFRVQAVYLTRVAHIQSRFLDWVSFMTNLGVSIQSRPNVMPGDELWALNGGFGVSVLRKREKDSGYVQVALATFIPNKQGADGSFPPSKSEFYTLVMKMARTKGLEWVEIL